jgi:heat shock protein 4
MMAADYFLPRDNPLTSRLQVIFCNKLDQLKTHGSPLEARAHEASARPEAAASFKAALEEYRRFVSSVNRGDDKYSHMTQEQTEKVSGNCNEAESWLEDKMNAQKDLALYQNPVVKAHEIKSRMTSLQVQCRQSLLLPKRKNPLQ